MNGNHHLSKYPSRGQPPITFLAQFLYLHQRKGLHRILRRPFPRSAIVPSFVSFEKLGNVWDQRVIGVRVGEQTANGKQNLTDGQGGTPLVLQNIQTDTSIRVDVAVIDASSEMNLWRLEWIVRRKVDIEEENATCIGRVIGSHDSCLPVEHVITDWTCGTVGWRVLPQIDQFYYSCKLRRDHEQKIYHPMRERRLEMPVVTTRNH